MKGLDIAFDRRGFLCTMAATLSLAVPRFAPAAAYPAKPIRLIVPSAPGGSPDVICRILADALHAALGQPVVVDNKPGAAGSLGMVELALAEPDGYTLGYANVGTLSINKLLLPKLAYDPDAYAGVALMGYVQSALVVRNELPVKTVKELIDYAKAHPGKLTMGSAGNGTTGHLGGELFKAMTGTFMVHVPYRGSTGALQDLMSGRVDLMFDNLNSVGPLILSGKVRALGVSGKRRSPVYPDLPSIQEAGVSGYEATAWGGIVGPKGLPDDIALRLNRAINQVLMRQDLQDKYSKLSMEPTESRPEQIMLMAKRETPRWAEVIKRSGATAE